MTFLELESEEPVVVEIDNHVVNGGWLKFCEELNQEFKDELTAISIGVKEPIKLSLLVLKGRDIGSLWERAIAVTHRSAWYSHRLHVKATQGVTTLECVP